MTDEFIKVSEKEINEDLEGISKILDSCKNDNGLKEKCQEIKNHLHKIKGLAPMMGKKGISEIASINDSLLKKILEDNMVDGIFETISESNQLMKNLMQDSTTEMNEFIKTIKTKHSAFLE